MKSETFNTDHDDDDDDDDDDNDNSGGRNVARKKPSRL
jgi:hypothetical protein